MKPTTIVLCASLVLSFVLIGCSGDSRTVISTDQASQAVDNHPIPVRVVENETGGWQLQRDGKAMEIKGAGGEGPLELLAQCGGNSGRLWGVDGNTRRRLDEAHRNGLSMAVGIWLEHIQQGFDYSNAEAVSKQFDKVIQAVNDFKDHPAVLIWGLGNEMEGYQTGDNPDLWRHVESLAARIKEIDPNHPTMTVVAEVSDTKIAAIHKHCPSLDIVGINSYGGVASVGERYRKAGGQKPYIVTEFGPIGTWEVPKDSLDAIAEPTSSEKAEMYRRAYSAIKADRDLCLGGYAFLWGNKQEGTATWFGMLLPNGTKVNSVDVMTQEWTGKPPTNLCPTIERLTIAGSNDVVPESVVEVSLTAKDPEGAALNAAWTLTGEAESYATGGHFQESPPIYDGAIVRADITGASIKMPKESGLYRLYVEVTDGQQAASTANVAIRVTGKDMVFDEPTSLPYVIYEDKDQVGDFAPSGWMGGTDLIEVDLDSTDNPKTGKTCIACSYRSGSGWGGVVWQHPHGDWGEQPGGMNFTGASRLTFWARGARGGEKVKFGFGILGREKTYWDTTKLEQEMELSDQWQEFSIDLSQSRLSRIKSPFLWVVAPNGSPVEFFLDGIVIEK